MTVITKRAEYAVISLIELASLDKDEIITTKIIAERQKIPLNLVVQILAELHRAGWTKSIRGASGGVSLVKDPSHINLREVIELFDGPVSITRCLTQDVPCNNRTSCTLRTVWQEAQHSMLSVLEKTTIKDLM